MDSLTDKEVITRKTHVCAWCGEDIEPFQSANYRSYVFQGDFTTDYMHPECHDAMNRADYFDDEGFDPGVNTRGKTERESEEAPDAE
jgi:hypothetical protein